MREPYFQTNQEDVNKLARELGSTLFNVNADGNGPARWLSSQDISALEKRIEWLEHEREFYKNLSEWQYRLVLEGHLMASKSL